MDTCVSVRGIHSSIKSRKNPKYSDKFQMCKHNRIQLVTAKFDLRVESDIKTCVLTINFQGN